MVSILQAAKQHSINIGKAQRARRQMVAGGHHSSCWPKVSEALGVHPKQIPSMQAYLKKHGINAKFRRDGKCVVGSQAEQNRIMRARGMFNYDAGYGDVAPETKHYEYLRQAEQQQQERFVEMGRQLMHQLGIR
jgi:hypothetical protein